MRKLRVLVTRPQPEADALAADLQAQGFEAYVFPTLTLQATTQETVPAGPWDWIVFISVNAVKFALPRLQAANCLSGHIAAVGTATAQVLQDRGVASVLYPRDSGGSEALLALPELQNMSELRVLIARGVQGRAFLAEILTERGATVTQWSCYEGHLPETTAYPWPTAIVDVITITSNQGLDNLCQLTPLDSQALRQVPLVVMSERIAAHARDLDFQHIITARTPQTRSLIESVQFFSQNHRDTL